MKISPAGRQLIERNEGLRLTAYPDPATGGDPWTIGYGDTGPDVVSGLTITKAEAERRLIVRLDREFGAAVNKAMGNVPTTQGQFDAMVSLAYNIGVGKPGGRGFINSSICRHHAAGEYAQAADAFLLYNRAGGRVLPGLTRRRQEERALYLSTGSQLEPAPPVRSAIERIKAIQRVLAEDNGYTGLIDGEYGRLSAAALNALARQAIQERT